MQAVLQGRFVTVTPVLLFQRQAGARCRPSPPPRPPAPPHPHRRPGLADTGRHLRPAPARHPRPLVDQPLAPGAWSDRTDAILTHPAYRDFYTWSAATHPHRHEHWELMAAVAVTHAQQVAAGNLAVEDLAGLIRRTWRSRTLAPRRQYLLCDPVALADRLPDRVTATPWPVAVLAGRRSPLPSCATRDATPSQPTWPVIDWMVQAVGPGWLTPAARTVLEDSLALVADFADTHRGFAAPPRRSAESTGSPPSWPTCPARPAKPSGP